MILVIDGSGAEKTIELLNLINETSLNQILTKFVYASMIHCIESMNC